MRGGMPSFAFRAGALFVVTASLLAATAQAQELVTEVGAEQQVAATGDSPSIAVDNQGRGIVAWVEVGPGAGAQSIRARRLTGDTLGPTFRVSTPSAHVLAGDPRVAIDAQGNFIVVWSANEIHGQLYRANGSKRGNELLLSQRNVAASHPEVAMSSDGRFVLGWEQSTSDPSRAVRLATFTAKGGRLGRATTMPAVGTMANLVGAVSASPASVAIGWTEFTPCPSNPIDPVSAVATFDWTLHALNATDRLANDNPCVDGPQVLALPGSDLGPLGIFVGRRYSIQRFSPADGTRVGPRTNIADLPPCTGATCELAKAVGGDARGRFVFIWERYENGAYSLFAELYGREGAKRVERFQITDHTSAAQEHPSAAFTSDGTLVVSWFRDGEGVLMRRFRIE